MPEIGKNIAEETKDFPVLEVPEQEFQPAEGDTLIGTVDIEQDDGNDLVGTMEVDAADMPATMPGIEDAPVLKADDNPYTLWEKAKHLMKDPDKEGAQAVQALVDSDIFKIRPSDALRYRDVIDRGVKINPTAASMRSDLTDRIGQSWQTGMDQKNKGLAGADYMLTGNPEAFERMQAIQLPSEAETFISESRLEDATRSAAKLLPIMLDIGMKSVGKGMQVGMGFGLISTLAGPGAPLAVPAATLAGFKIGATAGAFEQSLLIEGGLALSEIMDLEDEEGGKIDPNIARAAAFGVGAINAGIEVAQLRLLINTFPGMSKLFSDSIMKAVAGKNVKDKLLALGTKYASVVTMETAQEIAQESTNIVFTEVAKEVNNSLMDTNIDPTDAEEILNRLSATMKESAQGFAVIALPGTLAQAAGIAAKKKEKPGVTPEAGMIPEAEPVKLSPEAEKVFEEINKDFDRIVNLEGAELDAELQKIVDSVEAEAEIGPMVSEFKTQATRIVGEEKATVVTSLLDARAKAVGMSTDEYIEYHGLSIREGEVVEGDLAQIEEEGSGFKAWSGGNEVAEGYEIADVDPNKGYIFKVHHGTTNEFNIFDPTIKGTKEGQFGAVNYFTSDPSDADINYAGEGPDLTNRIESRKEQIEQEIEDISETEAIGLAEKYDLEFDPETETYPDGLPEAMAREELSGGQAITMDLYVKADNPAYIGGSQETWIENYDAEQYREEATEDILSENDADKSQIGEYEDEITERIDEMAIDDEGAIYEALQKAVNLSDAWGNVDIGKIYSELEIYDNEITATELEERLRASEELMYAESNEGELIQSHVIGQVFKHLGFDAIVLQNADKRFKNMAMGGETTHVHVFEETPANIKSSTENIGAYSLTDPDIYKQDPQVDQAGQPKASVTFTDTETIIHAFESADVSSLVHELGHVFRRDLGGQDVAIAEKWAGVKDGNWTVEAEEKFARGFENYLSTGKAPTEELKTVFEKLKQWLSEIYGAIKGTSIDVKISPEMQGVFDKLFLLDEDVTLEQKPEGPIAPEEQVMADLLETHFREDYIQGYSEEVLQEYEATLKKAITKAVEKLEKIHKKEDQVSLRDIKREAEDIASSSGVFADWNIAINEGGLNLETAYMNSDKETVKELMRRRPGLFKKGAGLHSEHLANRLGFDTADEMFQEWLTAGSKKDAVNRIMDDFVQEYEITSEIGRDITRREDLYDLELKELDNILLKKKPVDKKIKGVIRRETGQVREEEKTVTEREALKFALKKSVTAAKKAMSEGNKEGVAKEKVRMKEIINRASTRRKRFASIRQVKARIKKELKFAKVKRIGGKPVGKFTPEIQDTLNTLNRVAKLKPAEAERRLVDNLERYQEEPPPQEVLIENHMLEMVARLDTMDNIGGLQDLLEEIQVLKNEGRMIKDLEDFNRSEKTRARVETTVEELGGVPEGVTITGIQDYTAKTLAARAKQALKSLGKTIMGWDDLMDILSFKTETKPGESFVSRDNNLLGAKNTEKRGTRLAMDRVNADYMGAYDLKNGRQTLKRIHKDNTVEINLKKTPMTSPIDGSYFEMDLVFTRAELRKRVMEMADPTLRDSFKEMGYNSDTEAHIVSALTEQDKVFIQNQLDFYRDYYTGTNDVYKAIYGVNLPNNEFYSPIAREGITKPVDTGMGEFMKEMAFRASAASAGALKSRVGSVLTISKASDIAVMERHIAEMEHFKAWAERIRDLNAVWKNPDVRAGVEINHGKDMLFLVDNFISDIANGAATTGQKLSALDTFRINFTKAVLAVNPDVTIKQLTSFVAYAEKMPSNQFVKYLVQFWANPVKNMQNIYTSELMKARGQHIERDLKQAMQSKAHAAFAKQQSFTNMLMLNIQAGDQGAIVIGGWAYYKYMKDKKGMTHKQAIDAFEKFTENTQQSGDITEQSYWQRGGSLAKLLTMFASSPNQYLRKEIGAVRNYAAGRQGIGQTLKTLTIFHVLLPMFFQFVSDRFTWDEDEQKRAFIFGALNGWFVIGDGLDFILRKALGMKTFDMEIPIYSAFHDFVKATAIVDMFDLSAEEFFRAVRGVAGVAGAATGIPFKQFLDMGKGGVDVLDGEYEKGLTELMGYSPYLAKKLSED